MLCPHCSSPRHVLCTEGFRYKAAVNVNFAIVAADTDALTTLAGLTADTTTATNLLGPGPHVSEKCARGILHPVRNDESLLVVLPVFQDSGLAPFGKALLTATQPERLVQTTSGLTALDEHGKSFSGSYGCTMSLSLPEQNGQRSTALLIGLGNRSDCSKKGLCALLGTSIDSALSGLYNHLVIALADFTETAVLGREIGSVSRCRLSLAIVEDNAQLVLTEMSLLVKQEQVAALCQGIDVAAPLCINCNHPRSGTIKLVRPEPHQD